ncbi:unnamed protein product [Gongylonema pulchrum]|uniref:Uncharacterized protein n=1 Tax=Gongylonema pulchrum TaxID=637853 RepID=A0A183EX44_9BILA|nr:unnamed protein product [Gongylonema pulchrum]
MSDARVKFAVQQYDGSGMDDEEDEWFVPPAPLLAGLLHFISVSLTHSLTAIPFSHPTARGRCPANSLEW